ncbi:uncharacterized protein LOC128883186 isoform X2 [Hylaeus volcanicus]|uniref:uncharacterized protein LOC128883186 isoform X2 n=1 Tax=Hylaeus volcanicus TaxID=313075 RepID=UPI0023B85F70|nr:uncharacterized protein LOC128883186 isoform X2 [Hylaeus volcanicus]
MRAVSNLMEKKITNTQHPSSNTFFNTTNFSSSTLSKHLPTPHETPLHSPFFQHYLYQAQCEGIPASKALKLWYSKAEFFSPTVEACFQFLFEMGKTKEKIISEVFDILTSDFLMHVEKLPLIENENSSHATDSIIYFIENVSQFLHIPILRKIIQTLLTRQLGSLSFFLNRDILACMELPEFHNYSKLTLFLFSKSSIKQKILSSVVFATRKTRQWSLWENVVKNIVSSLELPDNKEFLHYCRNISPLELRILVWPMLSDWLVEEFLNKLSSMCLEVYLLNSEPIIKNFDYFELEKINIELETIEWVCFLISKSLFYYQLLVITLEFIYLNTCQEFTFKKCFLKKSLSHITTNTKTDNKNYTTVPIEELCLRICQKIQGLEYLLPCVHVVVLRQLSKIYGVSYARSVDPLAFNFITLMDRLVLASYPNNKCSAFTNNKIIAAQNSSFFYNPLENQQDSQQINTYNSTIFESTTECLRFFVIRSFHDLLTISFLLCNPTYQKLLIKLFIESQPVEQDTSMNPCLPGDFFLGLVLLGLSFPHCHSFVTTMLNKETKGTQHHSGDSSHHLNNLLSRTSEEFFMKRVKPTRKRQRICSKKVSNATTSLGNLTLGYLATQFYYSITCLQLCTLKCIFLLQNFFWRRNLTKNGNTSLLFKSTVSSVQMYKTSKVLTPVEWFNPEQAVQQSFSLSSNTITSFSHALHEIFQRNSYEESENNSFKQHEKDNNDEHSRNYQMNTSIDSKVMLLIILGSVESSCRLTHLKSFPLQIFKLLLKKNQQFKVYPLHCTTFIAHAVLRNELEHVKINPSSSQSEYIRLVLHHWTWPFNNCGFEKCHQHHVKRTTTGDESVPHIVFWSYLLRLDIYIMLITLFYPQLLQKTEPTLPIIERRYDGSQLGLFSVYKKHDLVVLMKHRNHLEFSLRYTKIFLEDNSLTKTQQRFIEKLQEKISLLLTSLNQLNTTSIC